MQIPKFRIGPAFETIAGFIILAIGPWFAAEVSQILSIGMGLVGLVLAGCGVHRILDA